MAWTTPLGAVTRGAAAGLAGVAAMDLLWYRRYRAGGGEDGFVDWEFSAGTTDYESAGAPARVGKRIVEGFLQRELPPESARTMNNVVHWLTGVGWGTAHGVTFGAAARRAHPWLGTVTGVVAWLASYAVLAPAGIYRPLSEYDAETLWKDLSAHLVFGGTTGLVYALVNAGRR